MKVLKINRCNEFFRKCFYLRSNKYKVRYECAHPKIVKKLQHSKSVCRKYKDNVRIPKWCPLEDYCDFCKLKLK